MAFLVCLAAVDPALAIDVDLPAHVRIRVEDEAGKPLPGASVTFAAGYEWREADAFERKSDADGLVALTLSRPKHMVVSDASDVGWPVGLVVRLAGFLEREDSLGLFPDAQIARKLTLQRKMTTRIRVCGSDGKPLPHLPVWLGKRRAATDGRGECVFEHGHLKDGLEVVVGGMSHSVADAPEVELRLKPDEMRFLHPARRLEGRLLASDKPAEGWFVARGTGCMGGTQWLRCPMVHHYRADELVRIGPTGAFTVENVEDHVIFVSPEGIPFLYPLNCATWPEGVRRAVVQAPPVRRFDKGRLVHEDGKGVAGHRVIAGGFCFDGQHFSLEVAASAEKRVPLSRARATDGSAIRGCVTDRDGWYEAPVYFGASTSLNFEPCVGYVTHSLPGSEATVLKPIREGKKPQKPKCKRILLTFHAENGKALDGVELQGYNGQSGGMVVISSSGSALKDSRGTHLFLAPDVDRLEVSAGATKWNTLRKTLDVPGEGDREIRVTLPDALRRRPLAGTVLDPDGKPVEGVSVSLYEPPRDGGDSPHYLGFNATTDAQGRFAFDAAPDECFISLYRYATDGNAWSLPGWTSPVEVKRGERDIAVRLKRCGSVRVLLPAGAAGLSGNLWLERTTSSAPHPHPQGSYTLVADSQTPDALRAPYVAPGHYDLRSYLSGIEYDLRGIEGLTVTVEPGTEATVDLRGGKRFPPRKLPESWTEITIAAAGKPVSGATVRVFAMEDPEELILQPVSSDLSDEGGRVRFRAADGRRYVVTARVHGRLIGWRGFAASQGKGIEVEMGRAKTLVVRLSARKPAEQDYDPRLVYLQVLHLPADEALALLRAWGLSAPSEKDKLTGRLDSDGRATFVAEDLPVNASVKLQVRRWGEDVLAQREVTVAPDAAPEQQVSIETKDEP
jgi:hypothetical protein